jgi:hypothetical protein
VTTPNSGLTSGEIQPITLASDGSFTPYATGLRSPYVYFGVFSNIDLLFKFTIMNF